jgi:hypothetical protein
MERARGLCPRDFTAAVAHRGIEPETREVYENGVRKAIYRDPDGNEIGVGGPPDGPGEL